MYDDGGQRLVFAWFSFLLLKRQLPAEGTGGPQKRWTLIRMDGDSLQVCVAFTPKPKKDLESVDFRLSPAQFLNRINKAAAPLINPLIKSN